MSTKLTLNIDQSLLEKAKKYAESKNRSLSDLVEIYLKAVTTETTHEEIEITPIVKSLKGSFKMPANFDYKKKLMNELSDKYL